MAEPDVIIVGSGPIGVATAIALAEAGAQVRVLEAGSAITEPPGSHLRNLPGFREDPDAFFLAVEDYLDAVNEDPEENDLPEIYESRLLGGQSVVWTNNCPRPADFEIWAGLEPARWERQCRRAEALLGVLPEPSAGQPTSDAVAQRLRPLLQDQSREIRGLPLSGRVGQEHHVAFYACSDFLERAGPDVGGRIEVLPETEALRLLHRDGRVQAVEARPAGGAVERFEAPHTMIAGGAIATPRLLRRSGIDHPALGRGFSFHLLIFAQIVLEPALAAPTEQTEVPPRLYVPPTPAKPWHLQVLRDSCPLASDEPVDNPHRLLEFQAFYPVAFQEESVFETTEGVRERFRYSESAADREGFEAMRQDMEALACHLGDWRRGCEPAAEALRAHLVGTHRMDRPDWSGVTDQHCRMHGFENLYLAGLGLIPAKLAVNPTLTALALSLAACDTILAG